MTIAPKPDTNRRTNALFALPTPTRLQARHSQRWLWTAWLWLALAGLVDAQARHLYNYTMRHSLPEQVLPVLTAQISDQSSITPYQQQLILNVTPAEYQRVLELLGQLDVAPRSLLISVRNQSEGNGEDSRYGVEGRVGTGAVQVQTGGGYPAQSRDTRIAIEQRDRAESGTGSQQVRALENTPALISAGKVYPVRTDRYGNRELVPVSSGFYATVRIVGEEVIVDVDQHADRVQGRDIQTQGIQTQVRGRLGSWIPLGNLQASGQSRGRGTASYNSENYSSSTDLAIKVELVE